MRTTLEKQTKDEFPYNELRRDQICYLLKKLGPLTIWELVDTINGYYPYQNTNYYAVRKVLQRLRKREVVGIVNYKEVCKRLRWVDLYSFAYNKNLKRSLRSTDIGMELEGTVDEPVWAFINQ